MNYCAKKNLVSGVVYDAVHLEAAIEWKLRSKGDVTNWSLLIKDFNRLLDEHENISHIPF